MIIGINGRINSGKDLTGKIIQIITQNPHFTNEAVEKFLSRELLSPIFENKKFADKLKDIVCLLLNCTREQLEDREFKEKELGEEWWYYKNSQFKKIISVSEFENLRYNNKEHFHLVKPTPRLLLQLLGTECGRNIIHPNIWVNALFSNYRDKVDFNNNLPKSSNWIITDMRFPNELKAVKDRGGISIRVNRLYSTVVEQGNGNWATFSQTQFHPSETSLDSATFDFVINNDKDIEHLINEVRKILEKLNII